MNNFMFFKKVLILTNLDVLDIYFFTHLGTFSCSCSPKLQKVQKSPRPLLCNF